MKNADIKEILSYDPLTGMFRWLPRVEKWFNSRFAGKIAGHKTNHGYWRVVFNKKTYLGHRIAWYYHYGVWPQKIIDHIDRDRTNNAISNLRESTSRKNSQNRSNKIGASQTKCIHLAAGRWEVVVPDEILDVRYRLGCYKTLDEAKQVLNKATTDTEWLQSHKAYRINRRAWSSDRDLDHETVLAYLYYDPLTGYFYRKRNGVADLTKRIGYQDGLYRRIKLQTRRYFEHVLVMFYMTGRWPVLPVDHINGNSVSNEFQNLREISCAENAQNRRNKNGIDCGIRQTRNKIKRWEACITLCGIRHQIGTFNTKNEASAAWIDFREKNKMLIPYSLSDNVNCAPMMER